MPRLNVLSLDLDWFNQFRYADLRQTILDFCKTFSVSCKFPKQFAMFTEHHYMYPWCLELLDRSGSSRINVINIDEHHDFYCLDEVEFSGTNTRRIITCGNFFAFMAHEGILGTYDWITDQSPCYAGDFDFEFEIGRARCPKVRRVKNRSTVWSSSDVWRVVSGELFDGVAIIKSPGYTDQCETVVKDIKDGYKMYCPGVKIMENKCKSDFDYNHRHQRRSSMKRLVP